VKEVCVAGESPGRAEQQESSGVATEEKVADPRLAGTRGAQDTNGAEEPSGTDGDGDGGEDAGAGETEARRDTDPDPAADSAPDPESSPAPEPDPEVDADAHVEAASGAPDAGEDEVGGERAPAAPDAVSDPDPDPVSAGGTPTDEPGEPPSVVPDASEAASAPAGASGEAPALPDAPEPPTAAEGASEALGDADTGEAEADDEIADEVAAPSGLPEPAADSEDAEPKDAPGKDAPGNAAAAASRDTGGTASEESGRKTDGEPGKGAKAVTASAPYGTAAGEKKPAVSGLGTFVPLVSAERASGGGMSATTTQPVPEPREHTKQMPVPPVPPVPEESLKLLAELTNTPPPRQTVLRSVVRRFKIWTPLVVLLLIVVAVAQALRPLPDPVLTLTSASSYRFQGSALTLPWPGQGQSVVEVEGLGSLGSEGAQKPVPIASVTKVMTAYVILKDHPLNGGANGPQIKVDATAAKESKSPDESIATVSVGQSFTERQLLSMLLIPSGNNIARLLARWDSGTEAAFVKKMTTAAAGLGMKNTTYTGASGIQDTTKSTAADQLKLARQVMKNDVFRQIVATPNMKIPGVGLIYNNNNLLVKPNVIGIKTGSSTPAGGALMWAATKTVDGKTQLILGVVLEQQSGARVYDSLQLALTNSYNLITAAQQGLTSATVVKQGEVVGYVDDGLGGKTPVVTTKDLTAIGWAGLKAKLTLAAVSGGLPHSAKAGTKVGTLSFGSGQGQTSVPVALKSGLSAPSFGSKLTRVG
jgi:D-alanyl-D-alanine carboxypeptidase (penicillin-binding protein 5/6)